MVTATRTTTEQVITKAMAFPMDAIVDRYMDEHSVPEEVAREHERELKRYLSVCALSPEMRYGMHGPVDQLWHTFITYTVEYARFCEEVAGRFLHHTPAPPEAAHDPETVEKYRRTLEAYAETFSEEPPPESWPRVEDSAAMVGSACVACE